MSGPLAGVLVADFSRILAGPYATMLLADLGAEVVKVEGPHGDDTRTWMPPTRGEISTYYLGVNRGKRSIALDLRDPGDVAVAQELARRADVVIENLRPGGMAKYGLDFETVSATNPAVVYSSISGFGSGEGAHVPGYDLMVQAISGLMDLTGDPDGPPYRAGISVFDVMAGNHAVIGILAALRHREATGDGPARRGQPPLLGADRSGEPQQRLGRGRRRPAPHGQRAPERLPVRAARDRRRRPHRHRRERRPVPQALRGARPARRRRRPAVRPQRGPDGEPGRAAPDPRREAEGEDRPSSGSTCSSTRASRAGRSSRSTAGSRWPSASGSTRSWRSVRENERSRRRGIRSASRSPRPSTSCRRRSSTSTAPTLREWLGGGPMS